MEDPRATPDGRSPISLPLAVLPLCVLLVAFLAGALTLGLEGGVLIPCMLAAAAVAGVIAVRRGAQWRTIERVTGEKLAAVLPMILILLAIGMLIGTWMFGGTIPLLVVWGIRLVDPEYLPLTAFVATAAMSLCTGTSFGSAGTLGVALVGTAGALDGPLAATAGAVVSGAYLGDKLSPLSDTTNICALASGADLYAHIRNMLPTAVPSAVLALLVYGFLPGGVSDDAADPERGAALVVELEGAFHLGWPLLLPVAVVLGGILLKKPPVIVLALSSLVALALGVLRHGFQVEDALGSVLTGFAPAMTGVEAASFSPAFVGLVERGGLYSMAPTLVVILAAFLLAAGMEVSGSLDRILGALLARVRSVFGLISTTMLSGTTMISVTSHGGVTALIIGGLFEKAYDERRLARVNLSRSLEDSVTIVEPLLPWTVSALYMAGTLGVPTAVYLPWAAFCWGGALFSLFWAAVHPSHAWALPEIRQRIQPPTSLGKGRSVLMKKTGEKNQT